MDKGPTLPIWVLIVWPKIVNTPNAPEFICLICLPSPQVLDFNEKRLYWSFVVRVLLLLSNLTPLPHFNRLILGNFHELSIATYMETTETDR